MNPRFENLIWTMFLKHCFQSQLYKFQLAKIGAWNFFNFFLTKLQKSPGIAAFYNSSPKRPTGFQ